MNGFANASRIETKGMEVLRPFIEERAYNGRYVRTAKGALALALQRSFGDVLMNTDDLTVFGIEIKVEERWTGNLFLETWSNRNLDNKRNHSEHGSTPGWMVSQRADVMLYYFLNTDFLIVCPLFKLQQWAFGHGTIPGRIYAYPEKGQAKYAQMNDTWGRIVPVSDLMNEPDLQMKKLTVRQLALEDLDDPIPIVF